MAFRCVVWAQLLCGLLVVGCGDDSAGGGDDAAPGSPGGDPAAMLTPDAGPVLPMLDAGPLPTGNAGGGSEPPDAGDEDDPGFPVSDYCPEPRDTLPGDGEGLTVLAADRVDPWTAHVDADFVYFVDEAAGGDGLFRVPRAGGSVETIALGTSVSRPSAHGGYLYWVGFDQATRLQSIERAPLDATGATPEVLVGELDDATYMAVDAQGVFFADRNAQIIYRLPLDGSAAPEPFVMEVTVQGMADRDGFLYFTDFNTESVMRVATSGGEPERLADGFFVGSIAVTDTRVFFAASMTSLETVPLTGGEPVVVVSSGGQFDTVSVAGAAGDELFWYRGTHGTCPLLNRMRFDGTGQVGYAFPGAWGLITDGSDGFVGLGNRDSFDPAGEVVRFSL